MNAGNYTREEVGKPLTNIYFFKQKYYKDGKLHLLTEKKPYAFNKNQFYITKDFYYLKSSLRKKTSKDIPLEGLNTYFDIEGRWSKKLEVEGYGNFKNGRKDGTHIQYCPHEGDKKNSYIKSMKSYSQLGVLNGISVDIECPKNNRDNKQELLFTKTLFKHGYQYGPILKLNIMIDMNKYTPYVLQIADGCKHLNLNLCRQQWEIDLKKIEYKHILSLFTEAQGDTASYTTFFVDDILGDFNNFYGVERVKSDINYMDVFVYFSNRRKQQTSTLNNLFFVDRKFFDKSKNEYKQYKSFIKHFEYNYKLKQVPMFKTPELNLIKDWHYFTNLGVDNSLNDIERIEAGKMLKAKRCNNLELYSKWHNCFGTKNLKYGATHTGYFMNGKPEGQGTFKAPNGHQYVGNYKNGTFHGKGTMNYPNGGKYVGMWKEGVHHGQGSLTYYTDGKYTGKFIGEFRNGKSHQGKIIAPDGREIIIDAEKLNQYKKEVQQ